MAASLLFALSLTPPQFVHATQFNDIPNDVKALVIRAVVKAEYEDGRNPGRLASVCKEWARVTSTLRGNTGLPYRLSVYGHEDETHILEISLNPPIQGPDGEVVSSLHITTSPMEFLNNKHKEAFLVCHSQGTSFNKNAEQEPINGTFQYRKPPIFVENDEYIFMSTSFCGGRHHFLYSNLSSPAQNTRSIGDIDGYNFHHGCVTTFRSGRCQSQEEEISEILKILPIEVLFYFLRK